MAPEVSSSSAELQRGTACVATYTVTSPLEGVVLCGVVVDAARSELGALHAASAAAQATTATARQGITAAENIVPAGAQRVAIGQLVPDGTEGPISDRPSASSVRWRAWSCATRIRSWPSGTA